MVKRMSDVEIETRAKQLYNEMAGSYENTFASRLAYHQTVDKIIIKELKSHHNPSLLDIGGGEGSRTRKLITEGNVNYSTMLDISDQMCSRAQQRGGIDEVVCTDVLRYSPSCQYTIVTALWNVLGHLPSIDARIKTLSSMKNTLIPEGRIVFDVNNRHNFHYGWRSALKNILHDKTPGLASYGWFDLKTSIDSYPVYIHSPGEVFHLVKEAGLRLKRIFFIDYNSGRYTTRFRGQILCIAGI